MSKERNSTITRINQTFDYNIQLIENIQNHSIDAAVVFSVSLLETVLCEYFYFSKNRWFDHCRIPFEAIPILETPVAREKIREYLKKNRLTDDFFELRYIYENTTNPDLSALHELLKRRINFQNLEPQNSRGAITAYKFFLNIDLRHCLDSDKEKSKENLTILKKLIQARHGIIHRGRKSEITLSEIETVLNSLKYLKRILLDKLCVVYTNP